MKGVEATGRMRVCVRIGLVCPGQGLGQDGAPEFKVEPEMG